MKHISIIFKSYLLVCIVCQATCQYSEDEFPEEEDFEESDVNQNNAAGSINGTNGISNATMNRVLNQITNVISNVEKLNITGIVDEALGIRNNQTVRRFVNSIMETVFCNPFLANYNNCAHLKKTQAQ